MFREGVRGDGEGEGHFLRGLTGEEELLCGLGLKPGRDPRRAPSGAPAQRRPQFLLAVLHQLPQQLPPLGEQGGVPRVPNGFQGVQVGFLPGRRQRAGDMGTQAVTGLTCPTFSVKTWESVRGSLGMPVQGCHGPSRVRFPHTLPTIPQEKGEQEGARTGGPRRAQIRCGLPFVCARKSYRSGGTPWLSCPTLQRLPFLTDT